VHVVIDTTDAMSVPRVLPKGVHVAVLKMSEVEFTEQDIEYFVRTLTTALVNSIRSIEESPPTEAGLSSIDVPPPLIYRR
jgi:hypothetical protein